MSWTFPAEWWLFEISGDHAYEDVVTPLLLEVLQPIRGKTYADLGCGEGRVMRAVAKSGATVHGIDINHDLARHAAPAAVADVGALPFRDDAYDGVYSALTLEHVADHVAFFTEAARVTNQGGVLAMVTNHPVWTAPDSTPISDADGEVLWRPGDYFSNGSSEVPAGESTIVFHHRSMADLLNAASDAGWSLEHMIEQPHHEFEDQAGIPRLLACRWRLLD